MPTDDTQQDQNPLIDFLNAPEDAFIIDIDCSDCDLLASLAEQVAAGRPVEQVLPALSDHLRYWRDCREEFEALVAVLKAESDGSVRAALDDITRSLEDHAANPTNALPDNDETKK